MRTGDMTITFIPTLPQAVAVLVSTTVYAGQAYAAQNVGLPVLAVSEPETFILLGSGMVIAAMLFRRFKRKAT
jgi:hypothetical protein